LKDGRIDGIVIDNRAYLKPKMGGPETKAVKCPACNGFGTVSYGKKECRGCLDPLTGRGRGWIIIPKHLRREEGEEELHG